MSFDKEKNQENLKKFYELHREILKTLVDHPPVHLFSFNEFIKYYIDSPEAQLSSFFIAKCKEEYIGEALMWKEPADPVPYINPVGMLPPYQVEDIKYKLQFCKRIKIKYDFTPHTSSKSQRQPDLKQACRSG